MYQAKVNNSESLTLEQKGDNFFINGQEYEIDISEISSGYFHLITESKSVTAEVVNVDRKAKEFEIKVNGEIHHVSLKNKMDLLLDEMGISSTDDNALSEIKAPMPGLILDILIEPGQTVQKGDQLMVLEAMKMENVLKAPGEGVVKSIEVNKGQSVEKNQVLINF